MILFFQDGPASVGAPVNIGRGPLFLRIAVDAVGELRALDQPKDEPASGDKLYVYERIEPPAAVKPGALVVAELPERTVVTYQWMKPDDAERPVRDEWIRETEQWRSWCEAQKQLVLQKPAGDATGLFQDGQQRVV